MFWWGIWLPSFNLGFVAIHGKYAATAPTVTISAVTNYNQDRATFNAVVNPNGATTSLKFQYKRNVDAAWTDGATITGLVGGSQTVYSNQTGIPYTGTLYDVRAIGTNSAGVTTSGTTQFTTWSLKTYANATPGTYYLTIPTVEPTGLGPIVPSIYNVFIYGGGGGGSVYPGGAGGGYRLVSSRAFYSNANRQLTLIVGAGGAANNSGAGGTGGYTQIVASNFTSIDAGGGTGGTYAAYDYGGNVGYGDNGAYTGGAGASWSDTSGKIPITYVGGGGGAGIGGYGGNASAGNAYAYGGNGGTGGSAYGYNGGAGGYGYGSTASGGNGAYYGYGSGGSATGGAAGVGNGTAGLIYFQYYGA